MEEKTLHDSVARAEKAWNEISNKIVKAAINAVRNGFEDHYKGKPVPSEDAEGMILSAVTFGIERGFELKSHCPFDFLKEISIEVQDVRDILKAPATAPDATAN